MEFSQIWVHVILRHVNITLGQLAQRPSSRPPNTNSAGRRPWRELEAAVAVLAMDIDSDADLDSELEPSLTIPEVSGDGARQRTVTPSSTPAIVASKTSPRQATPTCAMRAICARDS